MAYIRDQNGNIIYDQNGNALTTIDGLGDDGGSGSGSVDTDWVDLSLPSSGWALNVLPIDTWTDI